MAIMMNPNVSWSMEINNTGIEWYDLQNPIADEIKNISIHTISTKQMMPEFKIEVDNKLVEVYLKWDSIHRKINVGCILIFDDLESEKVVDIQ